ncbi:hypothetical protein [Sulfobacillus harzensis]|uniref:Urease accessory protein UreH-like transmembrane domain-containing protein n=1 Tax=Sulfobacillus harzensis TaxID=2729629 RepID=A0A7Y0L2I0_9FIRM|nr:hypothetical protein [Sulfobacillus harzensis]NMP21883.1 hypothetical protein [Sulfobacillus harzensis]
MAALNLWNPALGLSIPMVILTAYLLGILHGITPDEHTWPITFSYAIGAYSTRGGLVAGLTFSFAFTIQRGIASELSYLALARWLQNPTVDLWVYVVVGLAMALAGLYMKNTGHVVHIHGTGTHIHKDDQPQMIPPSMALVHGFIAGWGFGAFALIIYTVLAPSMGRASLGWVPGVAFGLGTMTIQATAGALFGRWMRQLRLPESVARQVARRTASNTLFYGGSAFIVAGVGGLMFPQTMSWSIATPLHVHNLHNLGIGFALVTFTVIIVGLGTLIRSMREARRLVMGR